VDLSIDQQERYARHLLLEGWGGDGQERLLASAVRIVGTSQAALWAARYLASSGVGTLVVEAKVAEACRGSNPDVRLLSEGSVDLEIAPAGGPIEGAKAALQACAALLRGPSSSKPTGTRP